MWGPLVSMEHDDEAKLDAPMPYPMADKPDYPYGLRICLCDEQIEKLKLETDCDVGDTIEMRIVSRVTSVTKTDGPDGPCCRVELQIEQIAVEEE